MSLWTRFSGPCRQAPGVSEDEVCSDRTGAKRELGKPMSWWTTWRHSGESVGGQTKRQEVSRGKSRSAVVNFPQRLGPDPVAA